MEEAQDYAVLRAQLNGQQQFSVQETWDCFMSCVTVCFLEALRVLCESNLDPDQAEEVRRLMAQNGKDAKGKPAVLQCCYQCGWAGSVIRSRPVSGFMLYGPKGNAPDRIQAAEMIHDYWTGVWNENSIDTQEAAEPLQSIRPGP